MVNGIVLYIFVEYVKFEGWLKTGSNTAPRHIKNFGVQFNVALVQQLYRKSKIRPIFKFFPYTEIPLTQWKFRIEAVYFKQQKFLSKNITCGLELQPIHFLDFVTFIY